MTMTPGPTLPDFMCRFSSKPRRANCTEMHGMRCEKRVVVNDPAPAAQQNKDKDNSSPRCTTQPNPPQVAFGNRTPN